MHLQPITVSILDEGFLFKQKPHFYPDWLLMAATLLTEGPFSTRN
jgi:hypothetical protein